MKGKGRGPESSTEVYSQSSSDSRYCSHHFLSTFPARRDVVAACQNRFDIIRQCRDAMITGIQELKNQTALIDRLLNNIISSSHGKPQVTCASNQARKIKRI